MPIDPIPFDLEGLADIARQNPKLVNEVNQELGAPAEAAPAQEMPPAEDLAPAPESEAAPEPENTDADLGPATETTLESELAALNEQASGEKTPVSEEKPKAVLATGAEKPAEKPAEAPATQRDSDLKLDDRSSAALHPKTKKIIEERNQKIVAERNKAEALAKEKSAIEIELIKLRDEVKKAPVPKDVQDELAKLRERVRELDITKDPALEAKYDRPIAQNQEKILGILQEFGLGKNTKGQPDPAAIEELKKAGLNFTGLAPLIKKLSDAGEEGAAEELREILRENRRLEQAKTNEIGEWKTDYEAKRAQTQRLTAEQQEKTNTEVRDHANRIISEDLQVLAKDFPFVNRPADPLPSDSPAVTKAKLDAISAYDSAAKAVAESIAQIDPAKAPPAKIAEVNGRATAYAVQGIILKQHILPKLAKDLAELRARNTELEQKVGKIKQAGNLSRAHAAAAASPAGAKAALPESTEDAARQIAKEMGINIG